MSKLKISYLITCKDEVDTLRLLLFQLITHIDKNDEIIIIRDTSGTNKDTDVIINLDANFKKDKRIFLYLHDLNSNFAEHKNWANSKCCGDYIFQCDGDELPHQYLLENIKAIIESNNEIDLYFLPRINDFWGVTDRDCIQWGWKLTTRNITRPFFKQSYNFRMRNGTEISENNPAEWIEYWGQNIKNEKQSTTYILCNLNYNANIINYPDWQGRIYKNSPKIKWKGKLHEKIEGHKHYSLFPAQEEFTLYHDKTIEKQIETNLKYNKDFTPDENRGHNVFNKK